MNTENKENKNTTVTSAASTASTVPRTGHSWTVNPVNFQGIPAYLRENTKFCLWRRERRGSSITKVPYNPMTGQMAKTNDPSTFSDFTTVLKAYVIGITSPSRGTTSASSDTTFAGKTASSGKQDGGSNGGSSGRHGEGNSGKQGGNASNFDGIGIRVADNIGAIDIDHCIRDDGSLNDVASAILGIMNTTYFERSPSGTGLRGFFRLPSDFVYDKTVYYINNRTYGLEIYIPGTTNRFVTVTGDAFNAKGDLSLPGMHYSTGSTDSADSGGSGGTDQNSSLDDAGSLDGVGRSVTDGTSYRDVVVVDTDLRMVLDKFMKRKTKMDNASTTAVSYFTDEQVIAHAAASATGEKFMALYNGDWEDYYDSASEADMGFTAMLAFWCGRVEEQMDRIFRSSGMMRDKWDRRTGDSTYGEITIRNAVAGCSQVYRPVSSSPDDDFEDLDTRAIQEERDRRDREGYAFTPDYRFLTTSVASLSPHTNPRYESFQLGNSKLFVDYYRPIILVNETRGCWYIYDGRVWRPDNYEIRISEMAKDFYGILYSFANAITSEDTRSRFMKRVKALDLKRIRDTMIKDARSDKSITVKMDAFDRNKYLFNCHNGTIDLRTGDFRPHSPSDFMTKLTEVDYDPEATCTRWLSFLDEVFEGDTGRIRYLQKAIGYAMSGDTRLECLFILYGPTSRNGKGTLMETVLRILGEYGRTARPDMLSKKSFVDPSAPSEDVARLNGARMVNISEPDKSMVFDATLTKQMTGNNTLTARYLREGSFEFVPQFKLFIDSNHLPQISDMTMFESDRIRIIPFNRHFTEEERDIDLKQFFAQSHNLSGILNWCLEGFRLYQKEGLKMPDSVRDATREYREISDKVQMFCTQCLKKEKGEDLRAAAIYTRYKEWCSENGYKYENASRFRKKMETAGFTYMRRRPWKEPGVAMTTMVDDVTWANNEELEEGLVPV